MMLWEDLVVKCTLDPSMKKGDHQGSQNVTFHNLGLGNINSDVFAPRHDIYVHDDQKWKMRTLKAVTEMLKHENVNSSNY